MYSAKTKITKLDDKTRSWKLNLKYGKRNLSRSNSQRTNHKNNEHRKIQLLLTLTVALAALLVETPLADSSSSRRLLTPLLFRFVVCSITIGSWSRFTLKSTFIFILILATKLFVTLLFWNDVEAPPPAEAPFIGNGQISARLYGTVSPPKLYDDDCGSILHLRLLRTGSESKSKYEFSSTTIYLY